MAKILLATVRVCRSGGNILTNSSAYEQESVVTLSLGTGLHDYGELPLFQQTQFVFICYGFQKQEQWSNEKM